jgi:NAD(P)-dependent dehydrogenase (short-subunit alcohol dehydrogenase family)
MNLELKDKVAIISGGNKGSGAAAAEKLAAEGAKLFLTPVTKQILIQLRQPSKQLPGPKSVPSPSTSQKMAKVVRSLTQQSSNSDAQIFL